VLDLACGSGEVTLALIGAGVKPADIDACDPYTMEAIRNRISESNAEEAVVVVGGGKKGKKGKGKGKKGAANVSSDGGFSQVGLHSWSFEDIAGGSLEDRRYTTVVCSFALHLCDLSWLRLTCE
jgi:hypothetical protein